jgi:predicted dehydrogenase
VNTEVTAGLDYSRSMYKQWREFTDALIEGREPSHSARTVRPCMAALEATRRAMDTGEIIDVSSL